MPQTIRPQDFDFLATLDAWLRERRLPVEYAREQGVTPSAITQRCDRFGLKQKRGEGLVDKRTGATLNELWESGAFRVEDEPQQDPIPA